MIDLELLKNEIKLEEDECCMVFDFGCYFPYTNPEVLTFEFLLENQKFDDYILNRRYPNKSYQTITKTYNKKRSEIGYPLIMKIDKQKPQFLYVRIGMKDDYITLGFIIKTNMTKEKPISILSLHYIFDKKRFTFESLRKENENYIIHHWYNYNIEELDDNDIILRPTLSNNNKDIIYEEDIIIPAFAL